jgi:dTDP-4-dehydrorhamnose 3,5-epimerase
VNGPVLQRFEIDGVVRIIPRLFADERGAFSESYSARDFSEAVGGVTFVQDNIARSARRGTVRGLHMQVAPMAQAKLIRVLRGSIYDVAVDVRPGSPTYGRHVALELRANDGGQVFVPHGFLHGYCTLEHDTEVFYKVDAYYSPAHERSVHWADPDLAIDWPLRADEAVLSDKDARAPRLGEAAATLLGDCT